MDQVRLIHQAALWIKSLRSFATAFGHPCWAIGIEAASPYR
jgi:hypothetical protein